MDKPTIAKDKCTCVNCSHYAGILDTKDSYIHIHDYCEVWKTTIPDLSQYDEDFANIFSSVENGEANCFAFKPKSVNTLLSREELTDIFLENYGL